MTCATLQLQFMADQIIYSTKMPHSVKSLCDFTRESQNKKRPPGIRSNVQSSAGMQTVIIRLLITVYVGYIHTIAF